MSCNKVYQMNSQIQAMLWLHRISHESVAAHCVSAVMYTLSDLSRSAWLTSHELASSYKLIPWFLISKQGIDNETGGDWERDCCSLRFAQFTSPSGFASSKLYTFPQKPLIWHIVILFASTYHRWCVLVLLFFNLQIHLYRFEHSLH